MLEAFPGGNGESLHALRRLDNVDKHAIITPVLRLVTIGAPLRVQGTLVLREGTGLGIVESPDAADPPAQICFAEAKFVANEPVLPTLRKFSLAVTQALDMAERDGA